VSSCEILGLNLRTLQRWELNPEQGDRRRGPLNAASQSLSPQEKNRMIEVANSILYRDLSPWQIVAKLADTGEYLASESSFYRLLKQNRLLSHRTKSQRKTHHRPKDIVARNPNEVWSWDITYLKSPIKGIYYYLYLVEDIFSRMIVGWTIEEVESAEHAARLICRLCEEQNISKDQLRLHADNGGPMKGATMLATLQRLGVIPSFSRPSVSDDNPFSESLFKTLKYRPSFPDGAFAGLAEANEWVRRFVAWYNTEHLHSGIRFVTPRSRHDGNDEQILKSRSEVYSQARLLNPKRWSGKTRDWSKIEEVCLNPKRQAKVRLENQAA
jgi:putative transposase